MESVILFAIHCKHGLMQWSNTPPFGGRSWPGVGKNYINLCFWQVRNCGLA